MAKMNTINVKAETHAAVTALKRGSDRAASRANCEQDALQAHVCEAKAA